MTAVRTPEIQLYEAMKAGDCSQAQIILNSNAPLALNNEKGATCLVYALLNPQLNCLIEQLLDRGAYEDFENSMLNHLGKYFHYGDAGVKDSQKIRDIFIKRNINIYSAHGTIIDLYFELGYGNIHDQLSRKFTSFGLCNGLSITAMIDFQDGLKGVDRFNERLSVIGKYTTEELVKRIKLANEIRYKVYKDYKEEINKIRKEQESTPDIILLEDGMDEIKEDDYREIISKIIKAEFENLNAEQLDALIKYFLEYYLDLSDTIKDTNLVKKDSAYYVKQKINTAINELIIQKNLDIETKVELKNQLGEDGELLLEIDTMIQNTSIGQDLFNHPELLNEDQKLSGVSQNTLAAFALTSSIQAEELGLINQAKGNFIGNCDEESVVLFFYHWNKKFEDKEFHSPIQFDIRANGHAILLTYLSKKEGWVFFDSNHAPAKTIKDTKMLAKSLMISLAMEESKLTFSAKVFSSKMDAPALKKCADELNEEFEWKDMQKIQPENKSDAIKLATKIGDTEKIKKIYEETEDSFFKRNWPALSFGIGSSALFFGGGIALVTATTLAFTLTFGIALAVCSPIILGMYIYTVWCLDEKNTSISSSKDIVKIDQSIHEKQNYYESEFSHTNMLNTLNIPRSNSAYKAHCKTLNIKLKEQIMAFFTIEDRKENFSSLFFGERVVNNEAKKKIPFSNHGKKMYEELLNDKDSPEIVLSRVMSHALNALRNSSDFSCYIRNDAVKNIYNKISNLIDVDETFKNIEKRIEQLSDKVSGLFAGTPIEINGKSVRVSGKVAEVYMMIQNAKCANDSMKLNVLARLLKFSERESSITTSLKSFFSIRDDAVWQFFGQMNELFVVKESATIDLGNTKSKKPLNNPRCEDYAVNRPIFNV